MGDLQPKYSPQVVLEDEKENWNNVHVIPERRGLSKHRYKELLGIMAVKIEKEGTMLTMNDKSPQENCTGTYRISRPRSVTKGGAKRRRLYIPQRESSCSDMEESLDNGYIKTSAMNGSTPDMSEWKSQGRKLHPSYSTGSQDNTDHQIDKATCVTCRHGENLLSCTGRGCMRSFHLGCLNPPLSYKPPGAWFCIWCVKQKIESGVYDVSPGVEAILDDREVPADDEGIEGEKQYLVKFRGLAHIHCRWIPEGKLIVHAPTLLRKYRGRNQKVDWKTDWSIPQRLLQKRLLLFQEDNYIVGGPDSCRYEWLVKWRGLTYEYATWELENASFLTSPEAKKLIEYFEERHERATSELYTSNLDEGEKADHLQFSNLAFKDFKGSDEISNDHSTYVNSLHQTWLRRRNSVIMDEQERITRVTLFLLYLQKNVNQPSLVITSSTYISIWEAEFSRWLPSANVVVYRGKRDVREMIRTLEFYNESGCIMFQVLLSTLDATIEDQDYIESLNWEVIVVDEIQRPYVPLRLNQIKKLQTNMRLLLIADNIKDTRSNYNNILSFLDHEHEEYHEDSLDARVNNETLKLKEKMNQFLAYQCPFTTKRFLEYWVPVQLSDVQRKQYCATLLTNSTLLCSSPNDDSFGSLHDIMLSIRKCCDHPYLVNFSLRSSVIQGIQDAHILDAEIEVSGKLRLLDKMLGKIKERGLRVLILFQIIGASGRVSIGDIIDDFIHQRYGDSYSRIDGDISLSKQQEAASLFNNDEGKFICLIETRACVPTITLQSVDTIILFNSSWQPLNDLKSLQKIKITSQFDQLKVFRLYSSCTLEESLLVFAKEGASVGCSLKKIKQITCQRLLSWGASYQFRLLNSPDGSHVSCGEALLEQVLSELVMLLPTNSENNRSTGRKVISEVQINEGAFSCDISLLGEPENRLDDIPTWQLCENEPTHVFWKDLLHERRLHRLSKNIRKIQYLNDLVEESEPDSQDRNGRRKEAKGIANLTDLKYTLMAKQKPSLEGKRRKLTATAQLVHDKKSRRKNHKIAEKGKVLIGKKNMRVRRRKADSNMRTPNRTPTLFGSRVAQDPDTPAQNNVSLMHKVPAQFVSSTQPNISYSTFVDENNFMSGSLDAANVMLDTENNPRVGFSPLTSERRQPEIPVCGSVAGTARSDPWQIELDKIQRDLELAKKVHEEKTSQLQCECQKEIDEILKKYAMPLQSVETEFMQKKEDLLTSYNRVSRNKSLAEVMMQMRSSVHAAGSTGTQKVTTSAFMEEIHELFMQQTSTTDNPLVEKRPSLNPDQAVARIRTTGDRSLSTPCTSVDAVENLWAVTLPSRPCGSKGQLLVPNIRAGGNLQTGGVVRAPAPHLRNTSRRPDNLSSSQRLTIDPSC